MMKTLDIMISMKIVMMIDIDGNNARDENDNDECVDDDVCRVDIAI